MNGVEYLSAELFWDPWARTASTDVAENLYSAGKMDGLPLQGGVWVGYVALEVLLFRCQLAEIETP